LAAIRDYSESVEKRNEISLEDSLKKINEKIKAIEAPLEVQRAYCANNPTKQFSIDNRTPISRIKNLLKLFPVEPEEIKEVTTQSAEAKSMKNDLKRAAMSTRMVALMREKAFVEDLPDLQHSTLFVMNREWLSAQLTLFKQKNELGLLIRQKEATEKEIKDSNARGADQENGPLGEEIDEGENMDEEVESMDVDDEFMDGANVGEEMDTIRESPFEL
jgi:hypothetical protein